MVFENSEIMSIIIIIIISLLIILAIIGLFVGCCMRIFASFITDDVLPDYKVRRGDFIDDDIIKDTSVIFNITPTKEEKKKELQIIYEEVV